MAAADASGSRSITFGRVLVVMLVVLALIWLAPEIAAYVSDIDFDDVAHPYAIIFGFVVLDAVFPVFPSESLLNTASTLAAQSDSSIVLWRVAAAGWAGAVIGDSLLYWLSRTVLRRSMAGAVAKAEENPKVARAMRTMSGTAPIVIVFGRFVPGLRFVVSATMGLARFPYRQFLLWDVVGGGAWAISTCLTAYLVGSVIEDQPIISIAVSAVVTTVMLALLFNPIRNAWQQAESEPASDVKPGGSPLP
jgi:membrane-associated protein